MDISFTVLIVSAVNCFNTYFACINRVTMSKMEKGIF